MRVLIVGFQRSGTTLMRRLMLYHPQIKSMGHETMWLKNSKDKLKLGFDINKTSWGEKIPWYSSQLKRGFKGNIITYCNKWNEYFDPDASIIHIVRHPLDIALSNQVKYKFKIDAVLKRHSDQMNLRIPQFREFDNCIQIKFENLVTYPEETLMKIYKFCKLSSTNHIVNNAIHHKDLKFGGVNKDRGFGHKKKSVKFTYELTDSYKILNTIEGLQYE